MNGLVIRQHMLLQHSCRHRDLFEPGQCHGDSLLDFSHV